MSPEVSSELASAGAPSAWPGAQPPPCPGLDRVLALWPWRDQAEQAAEVIGRALGGFPEPGDPVWRASRLSRTGLPLELGFTTAEADLRYTVEVDRPDRPPTGRLGRALALGAELLGSGWSESIIDRLGRAQALASSQLEYGCWLGVRHRKCGRIDLKLYVEVPPSAWDGLRQWEEELLGRPPILPDRGVRVVMVGIEAGGRTVELYYQAHDVKATEITGLLRRADLGEEKRGAEVLAVLQRAYGLSLERGMPSPELGFSYSFSAGRCTSMTLYHYANMVFGGDGAIRRGLLGLAGHHGWDLETYEAMSRPVEGLRGYRTYHGMLGIVAPASGRLELGIGLVPPPDRAAEPDPETAGAPFYS